MKSWEEQAGIPVLNVFRTYGSRSIRFSQVFFSFNRTVTRFHEMFQERFLLNRNYNFKTEWYIPINFATKSNSSFNNTKPVTWLVPSSNVSWNFEVNPHEWLIVNKQASFYYVVNYDERNWKMIASSLNSNDFGKIPPLTRAQLLSDAFNLARSGRLNYRVALEMSKFLKRETDYLVLNSFFYVFEFFYYRFSGLDCFHIYQVSVS